ALKYNPRLVGAKLKLSQLQLQKGDTTDVTTALQNAQDAVRLAPRSLPARMLRSRALIAHGDVDEAETALNEILRQTPNVAMAHSLMGSLQLVKKNQASARREFERALALDPNSFEALRGSVLLDLADGRSGQARATVDR